MNHSRAAQLNPARVFTDSTTAAPAFEAAKIKLSTRLSEREVRRPKTRDRVRPKHPSQKLSDRAFQMSHCDSPINTQAFNLIEHRIMCWIRGIPPEYSTRCDHSDRYTSTLHRVNLHSGG